MVLDNKVSVDELELDIFDLISFLLHQLNLNLSRYDREPANNMNNIESVPPIIYTVSFTDKIIIIIMIIIIIIIIIYFKSITQRVVAQSLEPGAHDKSGRLL